MSIRNKWFSLIAWEILDTVSNNGGTMKDRDLYEILRRKYDISYSEFIKYLMILEVRGFLTVAMPKDDVRVVSIIKRV